jgi:hypothetical protein
MKSLLLCLIAISCASRPQAQLTDEAREVEVLATKPANCNVQGRVVGFDETGSRELALNRAVNQAADLKATGLFVNQEVQNGKVMNVHATAYKCD